MQVCFYKRLADRTHYQRIYNVVLALLAATWLTIFLNIIFKCFPVDRIWDMDNPDRELCPIQTSVNMRKLTIRRGMFQQTESDQLLDHHLVYVIAAYIPLHLRNPH